MPGIDTSQTAISRDFAGEERTFQLRLGELGELERICNSGIGAIAVRLGTHQFGFRDVREAIRLGLEGGGLDQARATALVKRYVDRRPLAESLGLASEIVGACLNGVEIPTSGKDQAAGSDDPETSPSSSRPGEPQDTPPLT